MVVKATPASNAREIQAIKELNQKVSRFLFGNGGDEIGMDEQFRNLQKDVSDLKSRVGKIEVQTERLAHIESDTKETKKMVQDMIGYAGVKWDRNNHPNRRESDKEKGNADKALDWFKDKVAPGLLQTLIIFLVSTGLILFVLHWQDIIK